jgi:hypothetical protein
MAGSSAAAATAKLKDAGDAGHATSFQRGARAAMIGAGRRFPPTLQLHESKPFIAPMDTFLTMALAVAVLVVPLACAYVIVLRLARCGSRDH